MPFSIEDLNKQAEELKAAGKMPSLEAVTKAIQETKNELMKPKGDNNRMTITPGAVVPSPAEKKQGILKPRGLTPAQEPDSTT